MVGRYKPAAPHSGYFVRVIKLSQELQPVLLSNLISSLAEVKPRTANNLPISGIAYSSTMVRPGNLFVAVVGRTTDGHKYINDAIQRGALAVVGTSEMPNLAVPYFRVNDSREALAILSAAFYKIPSRKLTVIGVTGTDGKTTTANLVYQILSTSGRKVGMITTVNAVIGDEKFDTGFHVTTPEAPEIQSYLARMVDAGLDSAVIEVTSQGLDQHRVSACEFDISVITNITHEHLDYHRTFEAYRSTKARLFTSLINSPPKENGSVKAAVLNRDDSSYDFLSRTSSAPQISYGFSKDADVHANEMNTLPVGVHFIVAGQTISGKKFSFPVATHLGGRFNVSNALAAITVGSGVLELDSEAVQSAIANFPGVPGRWEHINLGDQYPDLPDFLAVVDFAHTPNALKNVLESARQAIPGRVIAVFGSAGLRDREKRRMMAAISTQLADISIFTAEDPRTESLDQILNEMAIGAISQGGKEGKTFFRIPDRREAIRFAVKTARTGDLVIACGKGHEQSMCFGNIEYPWDDRVAMRSALAEHYKVPGPDMPYLPE